MENLIPNFAFIEGIADGPETQIGTAMAAILKQLPGRPVDEVRSGLHKALDYGARYALASGFVMTALDIEWKRLGGSSSDPTPWRREIERQENGLPYKAPLQEFAEEVFGDDRD